MKQYVFIFYIIILLISYQKVKSQEADVLKSHIPNITVASPQAASIAKVGEIPIDISTGRMNYSIPIFEIKEGDFSMPINLSYNYSGLLLDEAPGYAGVGWTFNIGGSILHSINGLDDTHREYNKEWVYNYINKLSPYNDYATPSGLTTIQHYLENIANDTFDGEPDKYTVNAGNLSCSFYLDKDNNAIFLKNENYKATGYSYNGFTITDDMGVNYIFNRISEVSKSSTESFSDYISSFLLTEINFPKTSNKILFEYESSTESYTDISISQTLTTTTTTFGVVENPTINNTKTFSIVAVNKLKRIITNSNLIELQYTNNPVEPAIAVIKNLTVKDKSENTVKSYDFTYSPWTGRRTNLLAVKYNGAIINTMEYDMTIPYPVMQNDSDYAKKDLWGYYNKNGTPATYGGSMDPFYNPDLIPDFSSTKTGALTKIIYQTKGYSVIEYEPNEVYMTSIDYSLPYEADDTMSTAVRAVTPVNSPGVNEQVFVVSNVPASINIISSLTNHTQINSYSDREAQVILFKEGESETPVYQKSQYWSAEGGGFIPNQLIFTEVKRIDITSPGTYYIRSNATSGASATLDVTFKQLPEFLNQTVGGIRVKKVQNCDFNGQCLTTNYNYNEAANSTGIMLQKPKFYSGYFIQDDVACSNTYNTLKFYNYTSIYPLSNFRGSPVLYKRVERVEWDGTIANGKTIFSYNGAPSSNSLKDEDNYFITGLLSSQVVKNQYNTDVSILKNTFQLGASRATPKSVYAVNCKEVKKQKFLFEGLCYTVYPRPSNNFVIDEYKHEAKNYSLLEEKNSSYFNGQEVVQKIVNTYDLDNGSLKNKQQTNSKGETLETRYYYPTDPEMASEPFVTELISKNRIGVPLEIKSYNTDKLSDQKTVYTKDVSTSNLLLPKYVYANKGTAEIDIAKDKKVTYDQYDDKGNILQYTLESGMPVSIIWGYNKTQPIAKIENSTYSQIEGHVANLQTLSDEDIDNCASNGCTEQNLRNALNGLRTSFPQGMVSTYTYNSLIGVTSITDPRGNISYYEYDTFGRLQFVKDKDLNVLQKYCYNYKGQQIDCNTAFVIAYKSIERSGSFTKNNCAAGQTGSVVVYTQTEGAVTSTTSQDDADASGLSKFNTDGQANANANGTCIILPPASPTGLTFTSATATSLNFSWTAVTGATGYKIYKNGADTGITSSTNTGSLSGLTASTAYNIQVLAVNTAGSGVLSNVVSMTTASAPVSNSCSLNFARLSGSCVLYKNSSSYLTRSTSGTSNGTMASGDTFYVVVNASTTYYKSITITSSVRGVLYDYAPSKAGSSVTSPTFTKTGSEVITINCSTDTML